MEILNKKTYSNTAKSEKLLISPKSSKEVENKLFNIMTDQKSQFYKKLLKALNIIRKCLINNKNYKLSKNIDKPNEKVANKKSSFFRQ